MDPVPTATPVAVPQPPPSVPLPPTQTVPSVSLPPVRPKVRWPFIIVLVIAVIASGAVIAYTRFGLFQPAKPAPAPQPVAMAPAAATPTPRPQPLFLTLTSPKSGDLAVNEELLIKGQTLPNVTVVIYSESDETDIESDAAGNFEGTVLLAKGVNTLVITAFADTGEEMSLNLDITYSP